MPLASVQQRCTPCQTICRPRKEPVPGVRSNFAEVSATNHKLRTTDTSQRQICTHAVAHSPCARHSQRRAGKIWESETDLHQLERIKNEMWKTKFCMIATHGENQIEMQEKDGIQINLTIPCDMNCARHQLEEERN